MAIQHRKVRIRVKSLGLPGVVLGKGLFVDCFDGRHDCNCNCHICVCVLQMEMATSFSLQASAP